MDDSTIEALREVLQDMTTAIELISSGERSGAALIHFIEEMLKTIESWAAKYNVFLDDGSSALNCAQVSQPNPEPRICPISNPEAQEAIDPQNLDQTMNGSLDMADPLARQQSTEGVAVQQSIVSLNQEVGTHNAEKEGDHLGHSQNDGAEKDGWQESASQTDHNSGITASMARRTTRSQAASMHVDITSTDNGEGNILSPQPGETSKADEAALHDEPYESKGDVIESPSWLPQGWITERGTGSNTGSKTKFYVDPTSKHRFRSKKEVLAFLGTTKRKRGRPRKNESLKDSPPEHADTAQAGAGSVHELVEGSNSEVQAHSNLSPSNNMSMQDSAAESVDTAKRKRGRPRKVDSAKNVAQAKDQCVEHMQAVYIPELVVTSNTEAQAPSCASPLTTNDAQPHAPASSIPMSTGPMTSTSIPLPPPSGQPSEWLVYESLASLPFPMFEHLRFVENNANKLAANNSPPTLWPWMLGNSECLKKPFTDIKVSESKVAEDSKQEEAVAPTASAAAEAQAGEVVPKRPKKAARKNAS